jgi:hypothetical protein
MTAIAEALAKLSKAELLALVTQVVTEKAVTQAPTVEEKPKCSAIASSTGERCTRTATQGETCKSHLDWDNDEALVKHAKSQAFVESRRQAKTGGGIDNHALAAAMRAEGVTPNGEPWKAAKALVAAGSTLEAAAKLVAAK